MAKREVWHPALYEPADIRAVQALAVYAQGAERQFPPGEEPPVPSPYEVKRALDWIIHHAAQTYDNGTDAAFHANDPHGRIAAFVDGRRSVGQQIVKLLTLKPDAIAKGEKRMRPVGRKRGAVAKSNEA